MNYIKQFSWSMSVFLSLSRFISGYLNVILSILSFLLLLHVISGYRKLSRPISGYLRLSCAILTCLCLPLVISGYIWLSSIRVLVEAGESKLLLFETFPLLLFFSFIYRGARAPKINNSNSDLSAFTDPILVKP